MKRFSLGAALALVLASALVHPAWASVIGDHGCYTVNGLSATKSVFRADGATTFDMAVSMEETTNMKVDYPWGDNKTGDSFNAGAFKQNWFMIRTSWGPYATKKSTDYTTAALQNFNRQLDINVLHASLAKYGQYLWFAGHRHGQTGLSNPGTQDILNYKNAVLQVKWELDNHPTYQTDDTRCWSYVPAI